MRDIRPAAVAGMFYPGNPAILFNDIEEMLAEAGKRQPREAEAPKALIVPHAGYVYSGPVAASAYLLLEGLRGRIERVVLFGPAHREYVRGMALPTASAFETPLGTIALDAEACEAAARMPEVVRSASVHALEHSLEVQLPFLQSVLDTFRLVPFAVGAASAEAVSRVIERLAGGPETLIVISSDLSHYQSYAAARQIDRSTADQILSLSATVDHEQACGATPVNGLLLWARRHGLRIELIDLRNSGDTSGDRSRVVGYGAFALYERGQAAVTGEDALGKALLRLARGAIGERFGLPSAEAPDLPELAQPAATFVTLTCDGELRGCIGSLEAHRPLREDVRENALAAAFRDPRFPPLEREEFGRTRVEVSLLTAPEPFPVASEADAVARLQPGVDGLIFTVGSYRSTFLPQVWESLADPRQFLIQLKRKAGLPADFWSNDVRLARYRVTKWKEAQSTPT